jgi:hypothetical protein
MSKQDIEIGFPALIGKGYEISDEDFNYTCLVLLGHKVLIGFTLSRPAYSEEV